MSVLKVGKSLIPSTAGSLFESNPGAGLARLKTVAEVHGASLHLPVFETVFEAYAAGLRAGDLYGLGMQFQTGLLESLPGEGPIEIGEPKSVKAEEVLEGAKEIMEPIEEEIPAPGEPGLGGPGLGIDPVLKVAADCETVVFQIRILTPFEQRLCETNDEIAGLQSMSEMLALERKRLDESIDALKEQIKATKQEIDSKTAEREDVTEQRKSLEETYDSLKATCEEEQSEGASGEGCVELQEWIDKGNLQKIGQLRSIADRLTDELTILTARERELGTSLAEAEKGAVEASTQSEINLKLSAEKGELLEKAKTSYGNIGADVAPNIGQMNKLAVGLTSISSTCASGGETCCELDELQLKQLNELKQLLDSGGAGEA